jgi:hypothetical protein
MIAADPGFSIHPDIYSTEEINDIITIIDKSAMIIPISEETAHRMRSEILFQHSHN